MLDLEQFKGQLKDINLMTLPDEIFDLNIALVQPYTSEAKSIFFGENKMYKYARYMKTHDMHITSFCTGNRLLLVNRETEKVESAAVVIQQNGYLPLLTMFITEASQRLQGLAKEIWKYLRLHYNFELDLNMLTKPGYQFLNQMGLHGYAVGI